MNDKQDTNTTKPKEDEPKSSQAPVTGWQFTAENKPDDNNKDRTTKPFASDTLSKPITWTEAEFVAHHKSLSWYMLLGLAAVVIAVLVYIYNHDVVSVIVVIAAAVFFGIVANRQPRTLEYMVDDNGLQIGAKKYDYDIFRSFSIVDEGSVSGLVFQPLKRFMPLVTVYYQPHNEKAIVDVVSKHLPLDNSHNDAIDNLMRRIHY